MMLVLAGILAHLDGFMNIAMEQTEEYVNGQLRVQQQQRCWYHWQQQL